MEAWVIIVDDDETDLKTAGDTLNGIGIEVTLLKSGTQLLEYLRDNTETEPNLILIDIFMPEMDGFETLEALREQRKDKPEIPVLFLSCDEESETRGFRMGAKDSIRKPLIPNVLTSRVQNALRIREKIQRLEKNARVDHMTGFLNKDAIEEKMKEICREDTGFLCVLDLDSFKLINDIYGHDTGDRALIRFADLLKHNMRSEDICGRIGGDEFVLFAKNMRTENELRRFTERINGDCIEMMKNLLGDQLKIAAGVSIGAAAVPAQGREYSELFRQADQALNKVKQNGKRGCALSGSLQSEMIDPSGMLNLESVTMILEERNISPNAMWMGREAFINIYRYMMRYMERYHGAAYRVLFTINPASPEAGSEHPALITEEFRQVIQESLRNSDVMVEVSKTQIFLLLPETQEAGVHVVIDRLMNKWNSSKLHGQAVITWETAPVQFQDRETPDQEKRRT